MYCVNFSLIFYFKKIQQPNDYFKVIKEENVRILITLTSSNEPIEVFGSESFYATPVEGVEGLKYQKFEWTDKTLWFHHLHFTSWDLGVMDDKKLYRLVKTFNRRWTVVSENGLNGRVIVSCKYF